MRGNISLSNLKYKYQTCYSRFYVLIFSCMSQWHWMIGPNRKIIYSWKIKCYPFFLFFICSSKMLHLERHFFCWVLVGVKVQRKYKYLLRHCFVTKLYFGDGTLAGILNSLSKCLNIFLLQKV